MAVQFSKIIEQVLIVLYDYMLTSDDEYCWYSLNQIREALPPEISGAFVRRAIDTLTGEGDVEIGVGDPEGEPANTEIYSLTNTGIERAERILKMIGWDLSDYHPAPHIDRILSRANEPELHAKISEDLQNLAKGIRENNEAAHTLGDEREVISGELEAAAVISSKESFRVQRLAVFILPALRFIADKLLGSALGETAKRLVELLIKVS